ncbi:MAG: hypothetical protein QHJ73_11155, partial [Armatimonadota bacterium]|nr:hypothetical protein [Armatimonadota bacterium]
AGWTAYGKAFQVPEPPQRRLGAVWGFFDARWHIEKAYHALFVRGGTWLSQQLAGPIDQGILDKAFVGAGWSIERLSQALKLAQTGLIRTYALSILAGAAALLLYFVLR